MKIGIIVGTRPEIIKMSPVIKYCEISGISHDVIHTQQHYSLNMDKIFFENLDLRYPELHLCVKSKAAHVQIGEIVAKCGDIFLKNNYDVVLVQGDTNTVLGAGLAAYKCGVKLGHVEAGLRSYDREMPEEINRIITDDLSDFCFCPTEVSKQNLLAEGIEENRLFVVGNTIVDALFGNLNKFENIDIISQFNLRRRYALVTLHRPANVDNQERISKIISILDDVGKNYDYQVVFPVHPRTKKRIAKTALYNNIFFLDPLGYFEFLALMKNSSLILTDSGGIQEEACVLNKPCITLRENTERPETLNVGANILTGLNRDRIIQAVDFWQKGELNWLNPFGEGNTSKKIIDILELQLKALGQ